MSLELPQIVATFVLAFFRIAGMMLFAPLFGSSRIPRRLKTLITAVLALSIASMVPAPAVMPTTLWDMTLGIAGETPPSAPSYD